MHPTIIKPEEIICNFAEDVFIVGFGQGDRYFIIQRVDEHPANFHIELDSQGQSCYNGLSEISVEVDKICFELNSQGSMHLKTGRIEIVDHIIGNPNYDRVIAEIEILNRSLINSRS